MSIGSGYASWRRAAALLLAVGGVCAPAASGATKEWKLAEGGTFGETSGWTPNGAPAAGDVARFNLDGSYTLRFDEDRQNRKLLIGDDKLVMDLGKFDYRLVGLAGPSIVMGVRTSDVARLTVKNGTLQSGAANLAGAGKSVGSVIVAGSGTWAAEGLLTVGQRGTGNITVTGGSVSAGSLKLANADGSRGIILLSGKNATLAVEKGATIGNGAKAAGTLVVRENSAAGFGGTLTINNGGELRLEGGSLSAGKVVNKAGGKFGFLSGTLNIDRSNLSIGKGGLLGEALALTLNKAVNIARTTRVEAGALLELAGGKFTSGETVNAGTIRLRGGKSVLGGHMTNGGAISVDKVATRIAAELVQEGTFTTAPGGTATFLSAVSGAGNFTGGGALRFEASYTPGAFDDFVRITGDVSFAPSADLVIDAGGNDERARLRVVGDALLGDVVVNVDRDHLVPGIPITLVRASSLSRAGELIVNGLDPGEYDIIETGTALVLVPFDGEIDGQPPFENFATVGAVPEPGVLGTVGIAAAGLLGRRRRHR